MATSTATKNGSASSADGGSSMSSRAFAGANIGNRGSGAGPTLAHSQQESPSAQKRSTNRSRSRTRSRGRSGGFVSGAVQKPNKLKDAEGGPVEKVEKKMQLRTPITQGDAIADVRRVQSLNTITSKPWSFVFWFSQNGAAGSRAARALELGIFEASVREIHQQNNSNRNSKEGDLKVLKNSHKLTQIEYKAYQGNYRRIFTFLRKNESLAKRAAAKEALAFSLPFFPNDLLETEQAILLKKTRAEEALAESRGVDPTDDPLWTPSDEYTCKQCGAKNCMYKMTQITGRKVDQSEDPIYTVKCQSCGYLWKAEGDTFSG